MLQYMLDTDTASYIMNRSNFGVIRRLELEAVGVVCISAVSRSELEFGVAVSPRQEKDRRALDIFLRHIEVLDYPSDAALDYTEIRAFLKSCGRLIGAHDLFIAAHARYLGLTLVSNNTREYTRVPGLKIENWA
jgi:tRNA(fMet)-specific endonuclease VapC